MTDLRKGLDSLAALVQNQLSGNPFSGDVYIFRGRRGDKEGADAMQGAKLGSRELRGVVAPARGSGRCGERAIARQCKLGSRVPLGQRMPKSAKRHLSFCRGHGCKCRPRKRIKEMGDESVLRARVREAMKTGNLPDHRPEHVWGGPGSGESCVVCGDPVDKEDVELEVQFTPNQGAGATNYHAHAKCFAVWELERRNGGSNGHSLPLADDGGIMPSRERNTTTQGERG